MKKYLQKRYKETDDTAMNVVTVEDVAATDGTVEDGAVEDGAVEDGAVEDGAVEDGAAADRTVEDVAATDGAVADGAAAVTEDTLMDGDEIFCVPVENGEKFPIVANNKNINNINVDNKDKLEESFELYTDELVYNFNVIEGPSDKNSIPTAPNGSGTSSTVFIEDGAAAVGTVEDGAAADGTVEDGAAADGTVEDGAAADGTVEDVAATAVEKATSIAITKLCIENWSKLQEQEKKLTMSEQYNPYAKIVALGHKSCEDHAKIIMSNKHNRVFMDCRPCIPIIPYHATSKKKGKYIYEHRMEDYNDPNQKPMALLKILASGNDYRQSFFWKELFEKSVDYEINQFEKNLIGLREAWSNICFVIHSFLYMSITLHFKIADTKSPFYKYDSNNGEMYVTLFLGTMKVITVKEIQAAASKKAKTSNYQEINDDPYFKFRRDFKIHFSKFTSKFNETNFIDFIKNYFNLPQLLYVPDGDTAKTMREVVSLLWLYIEKTWEKGSDTASDITEANKDYNDGKKKSSPPLNPKLIKEVATKYRLKRLFEKHVTHTPTIVECEELKIIINNLLRDMIRRGGGKDEHDIVILYMNENGEYVTQLISIKNLNNSSDHARFGKAVGTRFYIFHMKVTHAILNYLNEYKDSSPTLKKLAILLDLPSASVQQSGGASGNTLKSGIENGEMGLRLMATFTFITQQLLLHFYAEFVYLYKLIRKILKKDGEYHTIFRNQVLLNYILRDKSVFNFWEVYQIAKVMVDEIDEQDERHALLESLKEECRRIFKLRYITGIDGEETTLETDKQIRKGQLFDTILRNVLSNLKTLHIISILSNRFPIERDDMTKLNVLDTKNYYVHTSSFEALTGFLIRHETLGSKSLMTYTDPPSEKYTNMQQTALFVVSEREAMLVSSHHSDKLLTFIMSCGNINRGREITLSNCKNIKDGTQQPFDKTYIDNLITKWRTDGREFLYPSDGIITTITQNKPTLALLLFPISSSDEEMFDMWKKDYDYVKYYLETYNKNQKRLRELYEHLQLNVEERKKIYNEALDTILCSIPLNEKAKQLARSNSTILASAFQVRNRGSINNYYFTFFQKNIELTDAEKLILEKLANSIVSSENNRTSLKEALIYLYKTEINKEDYSPIFVPKDQETSVKHQLKTQEAHDGEGSTVIPFHTVRRPSQRERDKLADRGGKKINTGIKKSFGGKMKNIYKIKGSNTNHIIYNKKLISVKKYKNELLLNKSKPTKQSLSPIPAKPAKPAKPVKPTKQSLSPIPPKPEKHVKPTKQSLSPKPAKPAKPVKPTKQSLSPIPPKPEKHVKPTKQSHSLSPPKPEKHVKPTKQSHSLSPPKPEKHVKPTKQSPSPSPPKPAKHVKPTKQSPSPSTPKQKQSPSPSPPKQNQSPSPSPPKQKQSPSPSPPKPEKHVKPTKQSHSLSPEKPAKHVKPTKQSPSPSPPKQKQSPSPSPPKQKQSPSPSPPKQKQSPSPSPPKQKQSPSPSPPKQKQSPSPSPPKPLVDKSNISKYNLRIEQYKNKNLSEYFINKLKTHINNNDDKNNIYKIGIKKIKVILKDIYKINR